MTTTDKTSPKLVSSTPKVNGNAVKVAQNIILNFDETIKAGNGNIVISNGHDTRIIAITDKSQIKISGKTLTINPKADLQSDSHYSVKIATTAITDTKGNKFNGISNDKTLYFNTIDKTAPVLNETNPANKSANVGIGANIVLTFSEPVKVGTGKITLNSDTDTRSISVTDKSQVSIDGNTITVNPKNLLNPTF